MLLKRNWRILAAGSAAALCQCVFVLPAGAAMVTSSSPEEAMLMSGNPTEVWDPKGATEISGNGLNSASPGNNEYALVYFNTASAVSQLNADYGTNGWTITSVGIQLASNFGTAGVYPNNNAFNEIEPGQFTFSWLSNNGWISSSSGGATWNNLPNYLPGVGNNLEESLGTFSFLANGTTPNAWQLTPTADFLSSIEAGGGVSLFGTPADNNVGYLFNTPTQSNPAVLDITAQASQPVPEPGSCALVLASLGMGALARRRRPGPTRL